MDNDSALTVIRIAPEKYDLKLICAGEESVPVNINVRQWCKRDGLLLAVNAGMFDLDHKTNIGYMRDYDYVNRRRKHPQYLSAAAFNPKSPIDKPFALFDLDVTPLDSINAHYNSVMQNMRLIKHDGENRWEPQDKRWTEVALGEDWRGRMLIIVCRKAYSMYALNERLALLPIGITAAQHLDGGPIGQMYIKVGDFEYGVCGYFRTLFREDDVNALFRGIPNVIGVSPK